MNVRLFSSVLLLLGSGISLYPSVARAVVLEGFSSCLEAQIFGDPVGLKYEAREKLMAPLTELGREALVHYQRTGEIAPSVVIGQGPAGVLAVLEIQRLAWGEFLERSAGKTAAEQEAIFREIEARMPIVIGGPSRVYHPDHGGETAAQGTLEIGDGLLSQGRNLSPLARLNPAEFKFDDTAGAGNDLRTAIATAPFAMPVIEDQVVVGSTSVPSDGNHPPYHVLQLKDASGKSGELKTAQVGAFVGGGEPRIPILNAADRAAVIGKLDRTDQPGAPARTEVNVMDGHAAGDPPRGAKLINGAGLSALKVAEKLYGYANQGSGPLKIFIVGLKLDLAGVGPLANLSRAMAAKGWKIEVIEDASLDSLKEAGNGAKAHWVAKPVRLGPKCTDAQMRELESTEFNAVYFAAGAEQKFYSQVMGGPVTEVAVYGNHPLTGKSAPIATQVTGVKRGDGSTMPVEAPWYNAGAGARPALEGVVGRGNHLPGELRNQVTNGAPDSVQVNGPLAEATGTKMFQNDQDLRQSTPTTFRPGRRTGPAVELRVEPARTARFELSASPSNEGTSALRMKQPLDTELAATLSNVRSSGAPADLRIGAELEFSVGGPGRLSFKAEHLASGTAIRELLGGDPGLLGRLARYAELNGGKGSLTFSFLPTGEIDLSSVGVHTTVEQVARASHSLARGEARLGEGPTNRVGQSDQVLDAVLQLPAISGLTEKDAVTQLGAKLFKVDAALVKVTPGTSPGANARRYYLLETPGREPLVAALDSINAKDLANVGRYVDDVDLLTQNGNPNIPRVLGMYNYVGRTGFDYKHGHTITVTEAARSAPARSSDWVPHDPGRGAAIGQALGAIHSGTRQAPKGFEHARELEFAAERDHTISLVEQQIAKVDTSKLDESQKRQLKEIAARGEAAYGKTPASQGVAINGNLEGNLVIPSAAERGGHPVQVTGWGLSIGLDSVDVGAKRVPVGTRLAAEELAKPVLMVIRAELRAKGQGSALEGNAASEAVGLLRAYFSHSPGALNDSNFSDTLRYFFLREDILAQGGKAINARSGDFWSNLRVLENALQKIRTR